MHDNRRKGLGVSNLIGLVGAKRAGKDTVADLLVPWGYERFAFADRVRQALLEVDPTFDVAVTGRRVRLSDLVKLHGWEGLKEHPHFGGELRGLLQRHGVAMRRVAPAVWVDAVMADVEWLLDLGTRCVVSDVRFENEVEAIRQRGGIIVRVRRREAEAVRDEHVSEQLWHRDDLVDVNIYNDGTIGQLDEAVHERIVTH